MNAKTLLTAPRRRWIPRIFLMIWLLTQTVFGVLAFSAPRYLVDQDLSALMMDLPKADRMALLVPIRLNFLQKEDPTVILLPNDDATVVIRHLTNDPKTLDTSDWTNWLLTQIETHYAPLASFQREVISASLMKLDAQHAAVSELAMSVDPYSWSLQLNGSSLQILQNLVRRKDTLRLRLDALDAIALALSEPLVDDIPVTVSDRYVTLAGLQVILMICGFGLAGWLTKRFAA